MAVYQIIKKGDSILREKAKEVPEITANILKLLTNMKDTMRASNGVGLAAPQLGIPKRVIVVETEDEVLELINPVLVSGEGQETDAEGCLSIPGLIGDVTRYAKVQVEALNKEGAKVTLHRDGLAARVLQHEIDHLDGILFTDKANNVRPAEQ